MWDPAVYQRFGSERSRPFFDLVQRIGAEAPRAVVDLGCGTGELTRTLGVRWPDARITGIDSSPEMIAAAPEGFALGDIAAWQPGPDTDVVVTNAALQWVPEHRELLPRWFAALPAGAWFAMQVPGNFDSPGHRVVRDLAPDLHREDPVDDAATYARQLIAAGAAVDAWETTYLHLLPFEGEHPVVRWMEGTALRPVRAALGDEEWQSFRAEFAARIAVVHPVRDGLVAFPFRRIFVVAHKGGA
ncbi:putative trans-aconitate methyltransferase [Actinoplanes missouriensis 431]|uniref:Putative trans-aconitate methyltransferase n=1 Tax=Actinoplanes missouriensis (strain ATCC 14538 / DSM 43046 / CBS 188.64 / JCM 3121 / NBRC 102363 / NCIMB 12654 / NRRL B-3342 / UNCC 431) TaxID=512565 RepID=I0HET6_ACTM4|nr:methyltransferase domain-containing protein [Actinoplanes missouriensis]BAL91523.1 putative trans-aconitate methyltransferase [Actinoplanes missouriensis 431]